MKYWKKGMSAALALALSAGLLAGCGQTGGDDGAGASGGNGGGSSGGGEGASDLVYVAEYVPIEGSYKSSFQNGIYSNGSIYATCYSMIQDNTPEGVTPEYEGEYWVYGNLLYKIGLDGTCEQLPYLPELPEAGEEGRQGSSVDMQSMAMDKDGNLYLLERNYRYWFDAPEGVTEEDEDYYNYYNSEESYQVTMLSKDGEMTGRVDLSSLTEVLEENDYFYVNGFAVTDDGEIVLCSDEQLYVLDTTGTLLFQAEVGNWVQNVAKASDGSIVCFYYGESGQEMATLDLEAKALGEGTPVLGEFYNMSSGGGDYDFYYSSGINFYGFRADTGERTKLLNWISCDVDMDNTSTTTVLDDGRVVSISAEWDSNYENTNNELIILTPKPANSVPQKEVLTLACLYLDYSVRSQIIEFNKKNDQYRIEVQDYSEYNTEDDYSAGLTKLQTEILTGNMPDLLDLNTLNVSQLAAKGILEDLYPYLDSDPDLSREDFLTNVLDAFSQDGKLCQTVGSFTIYTAVGPSDLVGDTPGWTVDDLQAAMAQMPEGASVFGTTTTRDEILMLSLYLDMANNVNWATGECHFDDPGFVKLLEYANSFPADFDWENYEWTEDDNDYNRIANGQQLLWIDSIGDFDDLQMSSAMLGGRPITYIGFPTEYGTGNMFSSSGSTFGMTTKCSNKDAAWQFLRQMFLESSQEDRRYFYGFPVNKNAFDKRLEEAMTPEYAKDENGNFLLDDDGNRIEVTDSWGMNGMTVEVGALDQAKADQFMELVNTTTKVLNYDESLNTIVTEGAAPYFEGERSAEDVAKQIQSKAVIYVNEQR